MNKRLLNMFLVLCMIVTMLPVSAMAEEIHTTIGGSGEIISFAPLTETEKTVSLGTSIEDLGLSETLTATVRIAAPPADKPVQDSVSSEEGVPLGGSVVATTGSAIEAELDEPKATGEATEPEWEETTVEIPVTWDSPDYDMDTEGAYVFTPIIEGYAVSSPLPEITVTVGAAIIGRGMVAPLSVTTYNVWVGGVQVTSASMGDVLGPMDEGVTVMYDSNTNTLTLSGAAITTSYTVSAANYGIYAPYGLNLKLVGTNSIALPNSIYTVYGISSDESDLQISAENNGSLTITTNGNFGVYSNNLTINSGAIATVSSVIFVGESVSISGGTVTSTGGTQGIVGKTITVSGGTVTASGSGKALTNSVGFPNFTGMQVTASLNENGTPAVSYDAANLATYKYIKIEPGATSPVLSEVADLTALQSAIDGATGDLDLKLSDSYSGGLGTVTIPSTCSHDITIDLNGKTLNGGSASAIEHLGSGALTITDSAGGGMVTSGTMGTIFARGIGTVNISGGTVSVTGGTERVAIWVGDNKTLNITGGTVSATGFLGIAIYSQNGTVNISGGTVSATGTNGKAILGETGAAGQLSISGGTVNAAGTSGFAINHSNATIQNGTTTIIQGSSGAIAYAPTLVGGVQGGASTNYDGSGLVAYNTAHWPTYKYLKFGLDVISPVLSAGSVVNRTSDTAATIGFTTDKAGTAYYLVVNSGASAPTSAAVKAGTSLSSVSGTVTGKAVALTAGEKDIYVVVEDSADNISTPLKIEAAAYVAPDTTPPAVTSVAVPANGTYSAGNNLDFTVNFDENVTVNTVSGTPYLSLTIGSTSRHATYVSGSGTTALTFRYTVQSGDSDSDGIGVNTSLSTNSGTVRDAAGNDVVLTLNSVGDTSGIRVDTPEAPSITGQPSPQTVNEGQSATFSVTASGTGLTYQWQVNTGSGFTNLSNGNTYSGTTTATLTITSVTSGMNGYQYRAVVNGTVLPAVNSSSATLTVNAVPTYTITANPTTKDFGSLAVGYSAPVAQTITITNVGNTSVTLTQPTSTNYTTGVLSDTTLVANGTATFTVTPKIGLAVGNYNETLTVNTNHSTNATVELGFAVTAAPTYTITANPTSKDFGSLAVGYSAPTAQTVTITNTGDTSVTLTQPSSANYTIGTLSATTLAENGTATFTVIPKIGLVVGAYNEILTVSTNHSTNATVSLSFSVTAIPTYIVTFNPNGGMVSETSRSVASGTTIGALPTPTRSGSYSFDGWYTVASGGIQISASTIVSENVTYYAHWTYTGGGGSGSGGGSSSNDNSSPVIVTPPAPDKPNSPTQGEIKVPGTVDSKGNVTVNITEKTVRDPFDKALAEAQKNGTEKNGITVVLRVDTGNKTGSNVTVNLPKAVQDTIIAKKIVNTIVVVNNPDIRIGMDLATVQEISRQAKSDVNITATRTDSSKLTAEAKKAIGSRPVFDLKVNYGNGKAVSSFGAGSVSVTIPYTLDTNEKAGNVQAVYVDSKGKVHWLVNSVYDSVEKVLRFATSHFSTYGIGYKQANTVFTDIAGHWAKEDIEFVVSRGLFSGTSNTAFSPNTTMTRGMFVTALGRLANADVSGYAKSSFSDVKGDAYYMGYIEWANKNNIVGGIGDYKFAPDQFITREQMAVIMSNYAKSIGYTLPKAHGENTFADNAKISAYAKETVKEMQMIGVISGKNGNLFDPQGTATRAEASAVLCRFVDLVISRDIM